MMTVNKFMAEMVKLHNKLMQDGLGDIPVLYLTGSWATPDVVHVASDMTASCRVYDARQIREWVYQGDDPVPTDMPEWLLTYEGKVLVLVNWNYVIL